MFTIQKLPSLQKVPKDWMLDKLFHFRPLSQNLYQGNTNHSVVSWCVCSSKPLTAPSSSFFLGKVFTTRAQCYKRLMPVIYEFS